jgi:Kef-type K+ transport system membrane component KefB
VSLLVVIVAARVLGMLFRRIHQPPVIGEVLAGIVLGPSLLGRVAPGASQWVLPDSVAPLLGVISQLGVILYMFLVGLELNTVLLRKRTHASITVSHASIVVPFTLGAILALGLYPRFSNDGVPFTVFALFMGVAMSVTAFPVLARILTDQGMQRTRLGTVALACAAVDDATAWCLLAFVVSLVNSEAGSVILTLALTGAYILAMIFLVRPLVLRFVHWHEASKNLTQNAFAGICVALLLSALCTEFIGIHALFGAFIVGAIVPHDSALAREVSGKIEDLVVVLLLPAFFAFTGLRTQIGLVQTLDQWLICGAIIVVASAGKFGGTAVAARLIGTPWREAMSLGVLMNPRGLMELIVLNVGLDLGVLSPTLFAMLVIMALVTTFATTPILRRLTQAEHDRLPEGQLVGG